MKDKKAKIIIICFIIVLVILVVLLLATKKSNNIYTPNIITNNSNTSNKELENINKVNNTVNETNDSENNTTVNNTSNISYKDVLMNNVWVKENLYIKQSVLGKEIDNSKKQDLSFLKINIENTDKSILLIQTKCDSESSIQLYYILEKDGQLAVNSIEEKSSHSGHVEYIAKENSGIIYKKSQYMEGVSFDIYSYNIEGIKKLGTIKMVTQSSANDPYKYYCNDKECTEKQYDEIYNKYINENNKNLLFLNLNEVNIKNNL